MTIQHFKKLYDVAKKDGIKEALKYDVIETAKRHPVAILGIGMLINELFYTTQIKGYRHIDEEVIPPNEEGLSLHQIGNEPIYERVPIWK